MRKGMPDMESCDSLERGVITMYNQVISGVNSEYDILLEECDVDSILKGRGDRSGFCNRSFEQHPGAWD